MGPEGAAGVSPRDVRLRPTTTYQRVLLRIESMIERLLLHAISIFKDLAPKKKQLYVTESYVFRLEADLLV
jgi:hypothetical protein